MLSNFQSFTLQTNANLIRLFRGSGQRKLQKIRPLIAGLPEFEKFLTVGRIKLPLSKSYINFIGPDCEEYMYFDISFRIPQNNIVDKNSKIVEFILNNVSEIIQVENDKNDIRFKSVLLAKIAHEFKNPINTINAICTNLNNKIQNSPELRRAMGKLQDNINNSTNNFNFIVSLCDYLLFLIEDLNTFVKMGINKKIDKDKGKNKDVKAIKDTKDNISFISDKSVSERSFTNKMNLLNLNQLLDFCYNLYYMKQAYDVGKPNLKILKHYSKNLPEKFYTNETKLKQILINLLSNAYKFTTSGFVKLLAKMVTKDNKQFILFSVTDTGTGIDKADVKKIFKPFEVAANSNVSNNCQGSGLGLSIVCDILELFGSKINLESEVGKGSTFSFELEHKDKQDYQFDKILEDEDDHEENDKIGKVYFNSQCI